MMEAPILTFDEALVMNWWTNQRAGSNSCRRTPNCCKMFSFTMTSYKEPIFPIVFAEHIYIYIIYPGFLNSKQCVIDGYMSH